MHTFRILPSFSPSSLGRRNRCAASADAMMADDSTPSLQLFSTLNQRNAPRAGRFSKSMTSRSNMPTCSISCLYATCLGSWQVFQERRSKIAISFAASGNVPFANRRIRVVQSSSITSRTKSATQLILSFYDATHAKSASRP